MFSLIKEEQRKFTKLSTPWLWRGETVGWSPVSRSSEWTAKGADTCVDFKGSHNGVSKHLILHWKRSLTLISHWETEQTSQVENNKTRRLQDAADVWGKVRLELMRAEEQRCHHINNKYVCLSNSNIERFEKRLINYNKTRKSFSFDKWIVYCGRGIEGMEVKSSNQSK